MAGPSRKGNMVFYGSVMFNLNKAHSLKHARPSLVQALDSFGRSPGNLRARVSAVGGGCFFFFCDGPGQAPDSLASGCQFHGCVGYGDGYAENREDEMKWKAFPIRAALMRTRMKKGGKIGNSKCDIGGQHDATVCRQLAHSCKCC